MRSACRLFGHGRGRHGAASSPTVAIVTGMLTATFGILQPAGRRTLGPAPEIYVTAWPARRLRSPTSGFAHRLRLIAFLAALVVRGGIALRLVVSGLQEPAGRPEMTGANSEWRVVAHSTLDALTSCACYSLFAILNRYSLFAIRYSLPLPPHNNSHTSARSALSR